jgi:hypothetical protein
MAEHGDAAVTAPDAFVLWMFPRLFRARLPRYEAIARTHGYTIAADRLANVVTEAEFVRAIEECLGG